MRITYDGEVGGETRTSKYTAITCDLHVLSRKFACTVPLNLHGTQPISNSTANASKARRESKWRM